MNQHPSNDEFEDNKLNELYKNGSKDTPSAQLNQRILAQAQQKTSAAQQTSSFSQNAILTVLASSRSLAVAAVLVLSLSVLLTLQFEQPDTLHTPVVELSLLQNSTLQDMTDQRQVEAEAITRSQMLNEQHTELSEQRARQAAERRQETDRKLRAEKMMKQAPPAMTVQPPAEPLVSAANQAADEMTEERADQLPKTESVSSQSVPALSAFAAREPDCESLTHLQCMHSARCTLMVQDHSTSCQPATDDCQRQFSQLLDTADACEQKAGCFYQASDCQCDDSGECLCTKNIIPGCYLKSK